MDFSKLNCSTSSYHISTNTGPIYMFFTKKCNYFSRATRRNHSFLSKLPLKGCFGTLKLSGHVHCPVLYKLEGSLVAKFLNNIVYVITLVIYRIWRLSVLLLIDECILYYWIITERCISYLYSDENMYRRNTMQK